ncbi:MAG: glycine cleavage system aminomethyltransferase GcvT [Rhizobiaceae bacterium]
MKHTPFYQTHIDAGAKMGAFAGFDMPLFYPLGVKKEHEHTRLQAGLFDISHMVHVSVSGPQAAALIATLCPYHADQQGVGQARYTFMLNAQAGIIDDLIVTRLADDRYLIVANAGCAEKDVAHVQDTAGNFDVSVDILPRAFLALQGPAAEAVLSDHFAVTEMDFMTAQEPTDGWFISRTGYTGEDGFEIAMPEGDGVAFANKLTGDVRVEWIGLGARDSLRLEAGLPLYGQDLSEEITPHEAGLLWAIPKDLRGEEGAFIGNDALAAKIAEGRRRMRIGLLPEGRPVRGETVLVDEAGNEIGTVTSGGFGPSLEGPMAMALVNVDAADAPIFADMRGKKIPMTRVKPPFVPHNYKR